MITEDKAYIRGDNMPRIAREKSETGIYHVMLRGIDKRDIFIKESDYQKFIEYIKKAKKKIEFTMYAYCLMSNHIHILLKTEEDVGDIIRRITVGYAQYHNIQNSRTGHLFQNRFKSEVVLKDDYFLTVIRYIHQNPVKAGIVEQIKEYKWSSYNEYINISHNNILIDPSFALGFFTNTEEFIKYMNGKNDDKCLDHNPPKRYTDESLKEFISSFVDISKLRELDIQSRNKVLKSIKDNTGASNRQLSRVLNIGRAIMDKI